MLSMVLRCFLVLSVHSMRLESAPLGRTSRSVLPLKESSSTSVASSYCKNLGFDFACADGSFCLRHGTCDGVRDCSDGSDEQSCGIIIGYESIPWIVAAVLGPLIVTVVIIVAILKYKGAIKPAAARATFIPVEVSGTPRSTTTIYPPIMLEAKPSSKIPSTPPLYSPSPAPSLPPSTPPPSSSALPPSPLPLPSSPLPPIPSRPPPPPPPSPPLLLLPPSQPQRPPSPPPSPPLLLLPLPPRSRRPPRAGYLDPINNPALATAQDT